MDEAVGRVGDTFETLEAELLALFRAGVEASFPDEAFNELALRVFRFQCRENPLYGAFVARRRVHPERVERWEEIPALPTRAFKAAALVAGPSDSVEAVFRTSGTTRGREARGEHHVRSLALYRASLRPNLQTHLLPEGRALPVLALLPSPEEAPDSSLSFMVGEAAKWWAGSAGADGVGEDGKGRPGTRDLAGKKSPEPTAFFVDPKSGIREDAFRIALGEAEAAGVPVFLAGTAFALAQWLEIVRNRGGRVRLPEGSRIMETGGYKGRVRALSRDELYGGMQDVFGVPPRRVVNEYGMTELLSQFYEPMLAVSAPGGGEAGDARFLRSPPWVRTLALHPLTLDPVSPGEPGILAHLDLANLGSVARVLTEDLGVLVPGGFTLQGRTPGAEPRGCSLAMEDFMTGMEER